MSDPRWGGSNPHGDHDGGRWGESHVDRGDYNHHSLYRGDSHISWNTDLNGDYIWGSGHTTFDGGISRWDSGPQDTRS